MHLTTTIRHHRTRAGLSQSALADRVGVSRQALSAIEAGRQVPSTLLSLHLARALGVTVDDLFRLADGPAVRARLAGGVHAGARVVVGRVGGSWVAHPLADGARAADGVVESAGDAGDEVAVELLVSPQSLESKLLIAGCAPLIGALEDRVGQRYRGVGATWVSANSTQALALLEEGLVHIAGVHLAESDAVEVHADTARHACGDAGATLVHLARWQQGVITARNNPMAIATAADLARPGLRLARRERGAAAQLLLERLLGEGATRPETEEATPEANSHADVAKLVKWGVADAGIAIEASALPDELSFVPVTEERFDLIVPNAVIERPETARIIESLCERAFRRDASALAGYDLRDAGTTYKVERGGAR